MPECGKALRTRAGFAKTTLRDLRLCLAPKIAKCVTEGVVMPRVDPVGESSPLRSAAAPFSFNLSRQRAVSLRSHRPQSGVCLIVGVFAIRRRSKSGGASSIGPADEGRRAVTIGAYDLIRGHAQIGTRVMTHGWEKAFSRWRMRPIAPIVQSLRKSGRPALED
jgi:hypothetical protein